MIPGSFDHVRMDPQDFCDWAARSGSIPGAALSVAVHAPLLTVLGVVYDPPIDPHLHHYPVEHARVSVFNDGQVVAVPVGDPGRAWHHRFPRSISAITDASWNLALGGLCLWYPRDPPHLRWQWAQGLDAYLRIVQRHLWLEEFWRRTGAWPVEDAPHGEPDDLKSHPIKTPSLRRPA